MDQKIYFYNTATRKKEEFKPIVPGKIGIYSCGPTVYWNQHIGHMYAYTQWGTMVNFLRYIGYEVKWVMNVTDVGHMTSDEDAGEDKMEKGAKREGVTVWDIAKKYEKQFIESLDVFNIQRPDVICRATEHIPEQIELAQKIEKNGFAYLTKTGLVYDTGKFVDYAKFANLKLEEMDSGARVEVDEDKKNPWDFLLWVTNQPKHIMKWLSPWGEGFPGWHIECTAMSTKYLGETFDIHTGGIEHIGVHHTNEIAQGYGAFGHQTANYWMHNAWLRLKGGVKMSKSLGNGYTADQLKEMGFDPLAHKLLVLTSHYRKGLEFSLDSLKASQTALLKLRSLVANWPDGGIIDENYKQNFVELLSDDLQVSEAIALAWKLTKDEKISSENRKATLLDFDKVLGLNLSKKVIEEEIPREIKELAQKRVEAKVNKNWEESDKLREIIKEKGYTLEDAKDGVKIRKI
ncbi:MAG: Cysteine-tRNA ligase [Candidatus Shapirobacteria bacterium GW2011_GWE1_38_10]|uniref:Cysteine--tRNA ligase n=1 Tax=Candidatus Shapirobacteria bacterium GW2011_GWE1_38_10 TaxID=1618488 RepID=A0A0G0LCS0_9BACT|nr:MAG: Cysteine-tRNA ligase [Candidatus Shapirobacteria bacterium GW2011_GWF2_37_20]KKQ50446.1 MAG: Cysteine-tRNA ligase [Candidatus Shapirobacteria bacterium GW2011_GWE1_38_10]KKQ65102.1 MAG: Cysteine-tRNA ligase [Candidatus Shapirobacteria bacterium GW2011_GWF1_38_23]HBP50859.1 cysteine--tRNA ligase [Candidatus Shapirobacteria bacterium]